MDWITTLAMNPTIDKNVSIDRVVPEHKLRCSKPSLDPGGGVNVARAIRKLGGKATLFYTAGGIYGRLLSRPWPTALRRWRPSDTAWRPVPRP